MFRIATFVVCIMSFVLGAGCATTQTAGLTPEQKETLRKAREIVEAAAKQPPAPTPKQIPQASHIVYGGPVTNIHTPPAMAVEVYGYGKVQASPPSNLNEGWKNGAQLVENAYRIQIIRNAESGHSAHAWCGHQCCLRRHPCTSSCRSGSCRCH